MRRLLPFAVFLAIALAPIRIARADVVDSCPHAWQSGGEGHGMSCETNWPVVGGGGALCGFVALLVAGLAVLAARRPSEGRGRGD